MAAKAIGIGIVIVGVATVGTYYGVQHYATREVRSALNDLQTDLAPETTFTYQRVSTNPMTRLVTISDVVVQNDELGPEPIRINQILVDELSLQSGNSIPRSARLSLEGMNFPLGELDRSKASCCRIWGIASSSAMWSFATTPIRKTAPCNWGWSNG